MPNRTPDPTNRPVDSQSASRPPAVALRDPNEPSPVPPVVAIRLTPCYEQDGFSVQQFITGPDERTTFWTLYSLHQDGMQRCILGESNRRFAEALAVSVADTLGVPVEPYPWAPDFEWDMQARQTLAAAAKSLPQERAEKVVRRATAAIERFVSHARTR